MKTKIKLWLISIFFTEGERMLIKMAIEDNAATLEKIRLKYRSVDADNLAEDIKVLNKISELFSTRLYR